MIFFLYLNNLVGFFFIEDQTLEFQTFQKNIKKIYISLPFHDITLVIENLSFYLCYTPRQLVSK